MKSRLFVKGRSFYLLLAAFALMILLLLSSAYIISTSALDTASEQTQAALAMLLDCQVENMGTAYSSDTYGELEAELRADPLLAVLGERTQVESDRLMRQAEELIAEYDSSISYGDGTQSYFYFQNMGYLMQAGLPGGNASGTVSASVMDSISYLAAIAEDDSDAPQKYLGTDESGEYYDIYLARLAPGAYLVRLSLGQPTYVLPPTMTENLPGVEMYTYDTFGNHHALEDARELEGAFTYETLGSDDTGTLEFSSGGHAYIGAYYTFNSRPIRLAVFCRDTAAENRAVTARFLLIAVVIAGAICLVAAFLLARWNYRPLEALVKRVGTDEGQETSTGLRDDYAILNRTLDAWDGQLETQNRMLVQLGLLCLLHDPNIEQIDAAQDNWMAAQAGKSLAVVLVECADGLLALEEQLAGRLEGEGYACRAVRDGEQLVFIIIMQEQQKDELVQILRQAQKEWTNETFSACVSTVHSSFSELCLCYNEVMAARAARPATETGGVLCYEALSSGEADEAGALSPEKLKALAQAVAACEQETALREYDALAAQVEMLGERGEDIREMAFSLLVNTIVLAALDVQLPGDISREAVRHYAASFRKAGDLVQLRAVLAEVLAAFRAYSDEPDDDRQLFLRMKQYIEDNFRNPALSAGMVAEQFGVSQSRISRSFKKYNQTGFLEYLHQLRVSEATRLLRQTDKTQAEIAQMVGYTNVYTMNRAFKTYANATPGRIRETGGQEQQ